MVMPACIARPTQVDAGISSDGMLGLLPCSGALWTDTRRTIPHEGEVT